MFVKKDGTGLALSYQTINKEKQVILLNLSNYYNINFIVAKLCKFNQFKSKIAIPYFPLQLKKKTSSIQLKF